MNLLLWGMIRLSRRAHWNSSWQLKKTHKMVVQRPLADYLLGQVDGAIVTETVAYMSKKKNTKVLPKIVFTLMQSTLLYSSICILTWIERRISCDTEVTVSANSLMPQLRFHCCVCWMNALLCIRRFEFQKVVCGGKCCVITSNNISITSHTTIFWYQAVAVT